MEESRRARYTHEFKLEALRMVGAGQSIEVDQFCETGSWER